MNKTKKLTLAAMCLALGIILPQAFHAVPNLGTIILPMHIPVLISGFICGPLYGLLIGLITPFISHILFGMPQVMMLTQMIIELGIYGFMTGILNKYVKNNNELLKNYIVLIISMIIGRIIKGISNALFFSVGSYSLSLWITTTFVKGIPGIIIQLILIPIIVKTLNKYTK